jgi:neutral ceramidase
MPSTRFCAGAAQIDITPTLGTALTGFIARGGASNGVHDPLFARALALETHEQRVILITCDLLALEAQFVAALRSAIYAAAAIPENQIMLACTHTHSGPATIFLRDCGEVDAPYLEWLKLRLVSLACAALANLRPAEIGISRGQLNRGVHNRRQPGVTVDPDLDMICFRDPAGPLRAVLLNYACHPVCLDHTNRQISADYPGYLCRMIQENTGAVTLFTNGATGDINPEHMGNFDYAEELGNTLAAETLRILAGVHYQGEAQIYWGGKTLELPLLPAPNCGELDHLLSLYRQQLAEGHANGLILEAKISEAMLGWAEATLTQVSQGTAPVHVPAEIQVLSLGSAALVGIPAELFSQLGKEIKSYAALRQVSVLGYTNGDIGYIPTRAAYALGGYEINDAYKYYGYPAALSPEAGELLLRSAVHLLEQCFSQP